MNHEELKMTVRRQQILAMPHLPRVLTIWVLMLRYVL